MPETTTAAAEPSKTFKVKVPAEAGKTITITRHDGSVTTLDVRAGVVACDTETDAHLLASIIEGATLKTEEK